MRGLREPPAAGAVLEVQRGHPLTPESDWVRLLPTLNPVTPLLQLAIGGLVLAVECDDSRLQESLAARYLTWQPGGDPAAGARHDCTVAVRGAPGPRPPARPSPEAFFAPDGICRVSAPGYEGSIAADARSATLRLAVPDSADVDYFLRAVLALVAMERGGLLVHGAGFLRHEQGVILLGPSGAGKSTSVRVSAGLAHTTALGDDLILLLPHERGWLAWGTPFWNPETPQALRTGQQRHGPLAGLFLLVQDAAVFVEPLSLAMAVAGLLGTLPIVTLDRQRVPGLITRTQQLAAHVPAGRLHFRPDASLWRAVDDFICAD